MIRGTLLVAVLVLAGCSSSSGGGGSGSTTGGVRITYPSGGLSLSAPSTSADAPASLRQWGSLMAGLESPVRSAARKIAGCTSFDYGVDATACTFGPFTFDLTVQTFSLNFGTGARRLGDPPSELAALVTSTKVDARAVHATERKVTAVCGRHLTTGCQQVLGSFYRSKDALIGDLDAWRPYAG